MDHVTSKDGTPIAYERQGSGPAVILVGGGLDDGSENAPLAAELAGRYTAYNYARRGRGESGDTLPYAVEREIEDIDALVSAAGGSAHLYGVSSGGALALRAAAAGLAIGRIAVYEVPYCVSGDMARRSREYVERLGPALAGGTPGDGLALFMRLAGYSDEEIAGARGAPVWPGLLALEHTLAYDAACMGDYRPPTDLLATITQPTLVATGAVAPDAQAGMGAMPADFFGQAADAIIASVPNAERRVIEGSGHVADPKAVAAVLAEFLRD